MLTEDIRDAIENDNLLYARTYVGETVTDIRAYQTELAELCCTNCRFENCDFTQTYFRKSQFIDCTFVDCAFEESYFKASVLRACEVRGGTFHQSHFKNVKLQGVGVYYGNFTNTIWESSTVDACSFKDALFSEVKLKTMRFGKTDFTRADFFRTPLKGVDLSDCVIAGITVSDDFRDLAGLKISPLQAVDIAALLGVVVES